MKILGIESSCDDTSVAIVDSRKKILSNERVSQHDIHQAYNGVVPELAARNHVITNRTQYFCSLSRREISS